MFLLHVFVTFDDKAKLGSFFNSAHGLLVHPRDNHDRRAPDPPRPNDRDRDRDRVHAPGPFVRAPKGSGPASGFETRPL